MKPHKQVERGHLKGRVSKGLIVVIMAICFSLVYLSSAIQFGSTDEAFFDRTFTKLDSRAKIGLNEGDFEAVKQKLIDYVGLRTKTFSVPVTLNGERVDFFDARERAHMVDVQNLFVLNDHILKGAIGLIILLYCVGKYGLKHRRLMAHSLALSGPLMLIVMGILGGLIARDFEGTFIRFHQLFFTNDLWLLDPAKDRMIVLLEEQFFNDMAIHIMTLTITMAVLGTAVGIVARKNEPK